MLKTRRISWVKIFVAFFLLAGLPIFIWAVATQRIELRKRAGGGSIALAIQPATATVAVGKTLNLGLVMNNASSIASVSATQLHITYDPTALEFKNFATGSAMPVILQPKTHTNGTFVVTLGVDPNKTFNGTGIIGTLSFTSLSSKASSVEFSHATTVTSSGYETSLVTSIVSTYGSQINGPLPTPTSPPQTVIPYSSPTPTPTPTQTHHINWQTTYASLQADDMTITANGKTFKGTPDPGTPASVGSDPGNADYTTLESIWKEHGIEMRLFIYFKAQTLSNGSRVWSVSEIRIYNGNMPGDWITFSAGGGPIMQLNTLIGRAFTAPSLHLTSSEGGIGDIQFTNVRLQAFLNQTPTPISCTPNGSACTILCPPIPYCPIGQACPSVNMPYPCSAQNLSPKGICQNNRCVPNYPTTTSYPSSTPTPTPPYGCYYEQIQCFQAPCHPILLCPSPTPYQSPTPTPTPVNLNPPLCGQSTIPPATGTAPLTVTLHGSGSAGNGPGIDGYRWDFENDGTWDTGVSIDPVSHTYTQPGTYYPKYQVHGVNNVWSNTCSYPYTISVTSMPINLTFKVKLAGVNGPEAKGATIKVKLKLKDGTVLPFDKPLVLNPVGNGVYSATATLTNPLPAGTAMRVLVKGEKHSQMVFCRASGQTDPCNDTEYMTPSSYSFDFTGRPLPPGDLNQDGKVNTDDLKFIIDLFKKSSTKLTAADLKTADVDYSGTVDAYDLNLVLQTLETRYDEQ